MSVFRSRLFHGKHALVTGGATGIGKCISQELLSLGCNVAIASRNTENLEKTSKHLSNSKLTQADAKVNYFTCNIRKEEEVKATVSRVLDDFDGKLDFLVNNGGGQFPSLNSEISSKGWNAVIETNLTGTFLMSKEVYLKVFKPNKKGSIVNIIADMNRGFPMMSHTGAARAGVENLTKSLAVEWCENGVRVNAVAPGVVRSKSASENYNFDIFSYAEPNLPTKRCGTPEEISSAVCFLLSPGASFINGTTLAVDGASSLYSPLMYQISDHESQPEYRWMTLEETK